MGSAASRVVIFGQKYPQNTKEMAIICFGHNFWTDAYFSIPLSLLIYSFPLITPLYDPETQQ